MPNMTFNLTLISVNMYAIIPFLVHTNFVIKYNVLSLLKNISVQHSGKHTWLVNIRLLVGYEFKPRQSPKAVSMSTKHYHVAQYRS